jgi:hypothetical protein
MKSLAASPVMDSENRNPYSRVNKLDGVAGVETITVGTVRSIKTSAAIASAAGPPTVPVIELASNFILSVPSPHPVAVTK